MGFDCFLSHTRRDAAGFAERLQGVLQARGLTAWRDMSDMRSRGLPFPAEIRDAIDESRFLVLVLSPRVAESAWVREEWRYAFFDRSLPIIPVLASGSAHVLPEPIKRLARPHVIDLSGEAFDQGVERLCAELRAPGLPLGPLLGDPLQLPARHVRRLDLLEQTTEALLRDVLGPEDATGSHGAGITAIVGMAGCGKSVLARATIELAVVRRRFGDGVVWLRSAAQTAERVTATLGRELGLEATDQGNPRAVAARLAEGHYLVVTDDPAGVDVLRPMLSAFRQGRSRLLVVTRLRSLADALGARAIEPPDFEDAEAAELLGIESDIAAEVCRACGGSPLALALAGAAARRRVLDWPGIIAALHRRLTELRAEQVDYPFRDVDAAVAVGLDTFAEGDRTRYGDLAVFDHPEPVPIPVVERLWATRHGDDPSTARLLLAELADASLLTVHARGGVTLHDLLHSFLRTRGRGTAVDHARVLDALRPVDGSWSAPAGSDECGGYRLRRLVFHLLRADRWAEARTLLDAEHEDGRSSWFAARFAEDDLAGFLADCDAVATYALATETDRLALALSAASARSSTLAVGLPVTAAAAGRGVWPWSRVVNLIATSRRPTIEEAAATLDARVCPPEHWLDTLTLLLDAQAPYDADVSTYRAVVAAMARSAPDDERRRQLAAGFLERCRQQPGAAVNVCLVRSVADWLSRDEVEEAVHLLPPDSSERFWLGLRLCRSSAAATEAVRTALAAASTAERDTFDPVAARINIAVGIVARAAQFAPAYCRRRAGPLLRKVIRLSPDWLLKNGVDLLPLVEPADRSRYLARVRSLATGDNVYVGVLRALALVPQLLEPGTIVELTDRCEFDLDRIDVLALAVYHGDRTCLPALIAAMESALPRYPADSIGRRDIILGVAPVAADLPHHLQVWLPASASGVQTTLWRAETTVAALPAVPETDQPHFLGQALDAVLAETYGNERSRALAVLAPVLPAALLRRVIADSTGPEDSGSLLRLVVALGALVGDGQVAEIASSVVRLATMTTEWHDALEVAVGLAEKRPHPTLLSAMTGLAADWPYADHRALAAARLSILTEEQGLLDRLVPLAAACLADADTGSGAGASLVVEVAARLASRCPPGSRRDDLVALAVAAATRGPGYGIPAQVRKLVAVLPEEGTPLIEQLFDPGRSDWAGGRAARKWVGELLETLDELLPARYALTIAQSLVLEAAIDSHDPARFLPALKEADRLRAEHPRAQWLLERISDSGRGMPALAARVASLGEGDLAVGVVELLDPADRTVRNGTNAWADAARRVAPMLSSDQLTRLLGSCTRPVSDSSAQRYQHLVLIAVAERWAELGDDPAAQSVVGMVTSARLRTIARLRVACRLARGRNELLLEALELLPTPEDESHSAAADMTALLEAVAALIPQVDDPAPVFRQLVSRWSTMRREVVIDELRVVLPALFPTVDAADGLLHDLTATIRRFPPRTKGGMAAG